jgi:hypothetical protein
VYGPVKTFANRSWGASRTARKKVLKRFTLRKRWGYNTSMIPFQIKRSYNWFLFDLLLVTAFY